MQNLLKELKAIKNQFSDIHNQSKQNPEEFFAKLGYDFDKLKNQSPEELRNTLKELESIRERMLTSFGKTGNPILNSDNRDSKKIENYYKKIQSQGGDANLTDIEKLLNFFDEYTKSETENIGQSCFHYDSSNCDLKIIDAHSLQKNGALKVISSEKHEVIFVEKELSTNKRVPKLIKRVNASTFKGFCHKHDEVFQKTIEKEVFDNSNEHCFLHSYRSFAYSYHIIKQRQDYIISILKSIETSVSPVLNALPDISSILGGNLNLPIQSLEDLQINDEQKKTLSTLRYETYKESINKYLENQDYDELDYIIYSKNHIVPLACSSWIKSHLHFGNGLLIHHNNELYHGYPILVTMIPESNGQTHTILARFKSDMISGFLFDELRALKTDDINKFELTLSSIILRFVENLYLSPQWWNSLDEYLKDNFLNEINLWSSNFMKLELSSTVVNFFDEIYKTQTSNSN
ncbi:MAG: hypothetical protein ACJAWV_002685 [Flammeovirgaceae bacterium]|jgi:hypothetical protein